jgi:hypothetical protein
MRPALAMVLCAMAALGTAACGGKRAAPGHRASATVTAADSEAAGTAGSPYLNDGDAEKKDDRDADNATPSHEDGDADSVEEYEGSNGNDRYHDGDDAAVVAGGHPLGANDAQAIAAVVKRYYAAAAAGDGAVACTMIAAPLRHAIPEDYGHESVGPLYLRAGRTCPQVMSLLFKHFRRGLRSAVAVTGTSALGGETRALLGSKTMPASVIAVTREGGSWKIDNLLGAPLP